MDKFTSTTSNRDKDTHLERKRETLLDRKKVLVHRLVWQMQRKEDTSQTPLRDICNIKSLKGGKKGPILNHPFKMDFS